MTPNTATTIIAIALLVVMGVVMMATQLQENAIIDEIAHTPAGISYITQGDMRLNPEHPPLLKDLAGLSVVTWAALTNTELNIPTDHVAWTNDLNGQWDFGFEFLYNRGNDPDRIVPIARLPLIVFALLVGWMLFAWTHKRYGALAGLFALALYAFSPTIIAHGRYVATDVGAMGGFLLGIITFVNYLKQPTRRNLVIAGVGFGVAQLIKFSLILLVPLFAGIGILWMLRCAVRSYRHARMDDNEPGAGRTLLTWTGRFAAMGIIAALVIGALYVPHIWNYPQERQIADIDEILETHGNKIGVATVKWSAQHSLTRPWAQYGLGVLMVTQRVVGGNTTFFLGNVNNIGWASYFPIVYLIKTPVALSILTLIALLTAAWQLKRFWVQPLHRLFNWFETHLEETTALLFIALYWVVSIRGSLNIGVRHLLPTFPFVYFLVAGMMRQWLHAPSGALEARSPFEMIKTFVVHAARTTGKIALVVVLLLWYIGSSLAVYPFYLPYFNELVGGPDKGHNYVVDSNLDWGQDMKRLVQFVDDRNIETLKLDYFGGGQPEYYLGDRFEPLHRGPATGWIAVSATLLKGGQANPTDFYIERTGQTADHYEWLLAHSPEAVIGHSIWVFHISETPAP